MVQAADWYGADLSGFTAEAVCYLRADAMEATSRSGTRFIDCTFRDSSFVDAQFSAAAFLNCTFTGCRLVGAEFRDCKFTGSMFDRCELARITINGGDWSLVGMPGADLKGASLRNVRMPELDLTGARCDGAVMRDLDLSRAMTGKASFIGADLRGSDLTVFDPWSLNLQNAVIDWRQAVTLAGNLGLDVRPDEA